MKTITLEADPVDVHVGSRVRLRRQQISQSQERLADDIGLTFQQVQKYEKGSNRISASKLVAIARSQRTPVGWYFEGVDPEHPTPAEEVGRARFQGSSLGRRWTEVGMALPATVAHAFLAGLEAAAAAIETPTEAR